MAKLTIKQIAAQAGVSIGTVDRVLHKRGRVSKETEALVLEILVCTGSLQISSHRDRINGFLSYLGEWRGHYHICAVKETAQDREQIYQTTLEALMACPQANALYINTAEPEPCLEALETYGQFDGIRFCFGHKRKTGPLIRLGKLDFAIGESPFAQGYRSGEAIFRCLLGYDMPAAPPTPSPASSPRACRRPMEKAPW